MSDYVLCKTVEPFRNSSQISHGLYPQERLLRLLLNLASCKNVDKSSIPNTAGNSMLNSTEAGRKCWPLLLRHFCTLMVISFLERDWKTAAGAAKASKGVGKVTLCSWVAVAVYQLFLTASCRSSTRLLRRSDQIRSRLLTHTIFLSCVVPPPTVSCLSVRQEKDKDREEERRRKKYCGYLGVVQGPSAVLSGQLPLVMGPAVLLHSLEKTRMVLFQSSPFS